MDKTCKSEKRLYSCWRCGHTVKRLPTIQEGCKFCREVERLNDKIKELKGKVITMDNSDNYEAGYNAGEATNKKTGYFARAVRGEGGETADSTDMRHNIRRGILLCNLLRASLPDMEIYCPHEHEDLFQIPYKKGDINAMQIMDQCLSILSLCDYLFVCSDPLKSEGVGIELLHATKKHIYVVKLDRIPELGWGEYLEKIGIRCVQ